MTPRCLVALVIALPLQAAADPGPAASIRAPAMDGALAPDLVAYAHVFANVLGGTARASAVTLPDVVTFAPGSTRVYSASRERLERLARAWRDHTEWAVITVSGHSGASGRAEAANRALAKRRADRIRGYLIRYGVAPTYVVAVGVTDRHDAARGVDLTIGACSDITARLHKERVIAQPGPDARPAPACLEAIAVTTSRRSQPDL